MFVDDAATEPAAVGLWLRGLERTELDHSGIGADNAASRSAMTSTLPCVAAASALEEMTELVDKLGLVAAGCRGDELVDKLGLVAAGCRGDELVDKLGLVAAGCRGDCEGEFLADSTTAQLSC